MIAKRKLIYRGRTPSQIATAGGVFATICSFQFVIWEIWAAVHRNLLGATALMVLACVCALAARRFVRDSGSWSSLSRAIEKNRRPGGAYREPGVPR